MNRAQQELHCKVCYTLQITLSDTDVMCRRRRLSTRCPSPSHPKIRNHCCVALRFTSNPQFDRRQAVACTCSCCWSWSLRQLRDELFRTKCRTEVWAKSLKSCIKTAKKTKNKSNYYLIMLKRRLLLGHSCYAIVQYLLRMSARRIHYRINNKIFVTWLNWSRRRLCAQV